MHFGIRTEIKADENRVAFTFARVAALRIRGSDVVIKREAQGRTASLPTRPICTWGRPLP